MNSMRSLYGNAVDSASASLRWLESMTLQKKLPNGVRYPRVGGRRQRHFAGTHLKPRKRLENAATPTRRVHAMLAGALCKWRSFIGLFPSHPAKQKRNHYSTLSVLT